MRDEKTPLRGEDVREVFEAVLPEEDLRQIIAKAKFEELSPPRYMGTNFTDITGYQGTSRWSPDGSSQATTALGFFAASSPAALSTVAARSGASAGTRMPDLADEIQSHAGTAGGPTDVSGGRAPRFPCGQPKTPAHKEAPHRLSRLHLVISGENRAANWPDRVGSVGPGGAGGNGPDRGRW